jgi:signal transduction histidine kinase
LAVFPLTLDAPLAREGLEGVELTVADSGVGISTADKEHLFKRFFRSAKTAPNHPGTGLGLAIVKALVDLHNGSIFVEDNSGNGTIFRVVFPKTR